ncbi:MAG: hypothetical protein HY606_04350 [Planctomycetes bacterium]|nr:hypothetical protein [Planctomycetota bacterium]
MYDQYPYFREKILRVVSWVMLSSICLGWAFFEIRFQVEEYLLYKQGIRTSALVTNVSLSERLEGARSFCKYRFVDNAGEIWIGSDYFSPHLPEMVNVDVDKNIEIVYLASKPRRNALWIPLARQFEHRNVTPKIDLFVRISSVIISLLVAFFLIRFVINIQLRLMFRRRNPA